MYIKANVTMVNDFSGGLMTKKTELNKMPVNTSPDCMDVYADNDGALHKRSGRAKLNSAQVASGARCNGLYDFEGTLIASFATTYYKMDELDGTFDSLQTGMKDSVIQCEDYLGNLIICSWQNDFAKTMQVGATSMTTMNSTHIAGRGAYPKIYKDMLLMSGVPGYPYTFFYSQVNDFDDFDDGGTWPIQTHDGDSLVGWGELDGRLYAFKRWSIHQMTFRGGSPYWVRRQITYGLGTRSPLTICNVTLENGNSVLMFLGSDRKLYMFDGFNCKPVSDNFEEPNGISPIAMKTLNQGALEYAHAIVDVDKHWYILFAANVGDTTCTHGLVYNYYTGAMWPFSNQTLAESCTVIDSLGRRVNIVGDYDGYSYLWHYGVKDNSTTISSYHTTPRLLLAAGTLRKDFEVTLDVKTNSDDTVAFQWRPDYKEAWSTAENIPQYHKSGEYYLGTTFVLGTSTLGPAEDKKQRTISLDNSATYVQFKISDSLTTDPWTLYAYELVGRNIAVTRQQDGAE